MVALMSPLHFLLWQENDSFPRILPWVLLPNRKVLLSTTPSAPPPPKVLWIFVTHMSFQDYQETRRWSPHQLYQVSNSFLYLLQASQFFLELNPFLLITYHTWSRANSSPGAYDSVFSVTADNRLRDTECHFPKIWDSCPRCVLRPPHSAQVWTFLLQQLPGWGDLQDPCKLSWSLIPRWYTGFSCSDILLPEHECWKHVHYTRREICTQSKYGVYVPPSLVNTEQSEHKEAAARSSVAILPCCRCIGFMPIQSQKNKSQRAVGKAVQQDREGGVLKNVTGSCNSDRHRGCGGQKQTLCLFESLAAAQARSLWQVSANDSKKEAGFAGKAWGFREHRECQASMTSSRSIWNSINPGLSRSHGPIEEWGSCRNWWGSENSRALGMFDFGQSYLSPLSITLFLGKIGIINILRLW